ncbi:MAG TPA: hypothetical protein VMU87_13385 [Stellaceae bacterium]|nr:hypothetical protein [Stellaceae bacterium]
MTLHPAILASFLLVQAPMLTKAESLAELYGRTLGAAAECKSIAHPRIDATAAAAAAHVKALAKDDAERTAAGRILAANVDRGGRDVQNGLVTCTQAESELSNLEHELAGSR